MESAGVAGSVRRKRAQVNISLFGPKSGPRDAFPDQPDIPFGQNIHAARL